MKKFEGISQASLRVKLFKYCSIILLDEKLASD